MRAVSLFSGAGGGVIALQRANLEVVAAIDFEPDAIATLRANGIDTAIQADVRTFPWHTLGQVNLLLGGPPCQPFSATGRHGGAYDERDCIPHFITAVAALHPQIFVMENVKGLTFAKHRDYLTMVLTELRSLGYVVDWRVLNAADYGVPQTRQRLFVVGRRDGEPVRWPVATHARNGAGGLRCWVSMASSLGWDTNTIVISNYGSGGDAKNRGTRSADEPAFTVTSKVGRNVVLHTNRDQRPDGSRQTVPTDAPALTFTVEAGAQWKWVFDRPVTTVAAENESQFQQGVVKVTPEEAAKLQDFPDDWQFVGTKSSRFRQIGNACPPKLLEVVISAQVADTFEQVSSEQFYAATRHAWDISKGDVTVGTMLDPDKQPWSYRHHRCYLTVDRLTGFAIDPAGDLQATFNVGPAGRGETAVSLAVSLGARTLNCFEPFLPTYYERFGFVVDRREDNLIKDRHLATYMKLVATKSVAH